jgi:hypothetical protein
MPSRLNNLFRILEWTDFNKVRRPAPGAGQKATAARTSAGFSIPAGVRFDPVPGSKPVIYRLKDDVIMNIALRSRECWVATWVVTLPQSDQDALLNHERGHYKIVALLARDFFWEIMALKLNDYKKAQDGLSDFDRIKQGYTSAVIQSVQDAYDDTKQVNHDPVTNANAQAIWDGLFADAVTQKTPLMDVLRAAQVYP